MYVSKTYIRAWTRLTEFTNILQSRAPVRNLVKQVVSRSFSISVVSPVFYPRISTRSNWIAKYLFQFIRTFFYLVDKNVIRIFLLWEDELKNTEEWYEEKNRVHQRESKWIIIENQERRWKDIENTSRRKRSSNKQDISWKNKEEQEEK